MEIFIENPARMAIQAGLACYSALKRGLYDRMVHDGTNTWWVDFSFYY
jgi:hypothetical protein